MEDKQSQFQSRLSFSFSEINDDNINLNDDNKIQQLQNEIKNKNEIIKSLIEAKIKLHKEIMEQTQTFRNKIRQYETLQEYHSNYDLNNENKKLKEEIRSLISQKESKHLMIDKLNYQNNELSIKNQKLKDDLERYKKGIIERENIVKQVTKEILELKQKYEVIENKDEIIESLNEEVKHLQNQLDELQDQLQVECDKYDNYVEKSEEEFNEIKHQLSLAISKCESVEYHELYSLSTLMLQLKSKKPELFRIISQLVKSGLDTELDNQNFNQTLCIDDIVYLLQSRYLSFRPNIESNNNIGNNDHNNNSYNNNSYNNVQDSYKLLHGSPINSSILSTPSNNNNNNNNTLSLDFQKNSKSIRKAPPRPPPKPPSSSSLSSSKLIVSITPTNNRVERNSHSQVDQPQNILRLLDFLTQTQILEIANYLCRTPILTSKTIELTKVDGINDNDYDDNYGNNISDNNNTIENNNNNNNDNDNESYYPPSINQAHIIKATEEIVMNIGESSKSSTLNKIPLTSSLKKDKKNYNLSSSILPTSPSIVSSRLAPQIPLKSSEKSVRINNDSEIIQSESSDEEENEIEYNNNYNNEYTNQDDNEDIIYGPNVNDWYDGDQQHIIYEHDYDEDDNRYYDIDEEEEQNEQNEYVEREDEYSYPKSNFENRYEDKNYIDIDNQENEKYDNNNNNNADDNNNNNDDDDDEIDLNQYQEYYEYKRSDDPIKDSIPTPFSPPSPLPVSLPQKQQDGRVKLSSSKWSPYNKYSNGPIEINNDSYDDDNNNNDSNPLDLNELTIGNNYNQLDKNFQNSSKGAYDQDVYDNGNDNIYSNYEFDNNRDPDPDPGSTLLQSENNDNFVAEVPESNPESNDQKVSEHLCFIIHRGGGDTEEYTERWIEFVDKSTGLPYYYNPDRNITQWTMPREIKDTLQSNISLTNASREMLI